MKSIIFIIVLIILTIVNYLIGAATTSNFNVSKWSYEWIEFIISEVIVVLGSVILTVLLLRIIQ